MGQIEGKGKLMCVNGVMYDGEWKHSQVHTDGQQSILHYFEVFISVMERESCVLQQRGSMKESFNTIRFMGRAQWCTRTRMCTRVDGKMGWSVLSLLL